MCHRSPHDAVFLRNILQPTQDYLIRPNYFEVIQKHFLNPTNRFHHSNSKAASSQSAAAAGGIPKEHSTTERTPYKEC